MKTALTATLILLGPLGAGVARADSDGYYCVGPRYLAYQFGYAAPPDRPHRLHVVRLAESGGIQDPIVFELPQFQVHGMRCEKGAVRLRAYDAIYTVRLDEVNQPIGYDKVALTGKGSIPPEFSGPTSNLGGWSRAASKLHTDRVALGPADGGGQYHLEIRGTDSTSERCTSIVTTRVYRVDRNGREVQQLEIFRGIGRRECGGVP